VSFSCSLLSLSSGPNKYNFHANERKWLGERDRHSLYDVMSKEFTRIYGVDIDFAHKF
jgi:frataxin-like iron-binding protein CyaY